MFTFDTLCSTTSGEAGRLPGVFAISTTFGEGTISQKQVKRWFARFKSGNTSLEDEKGRDRPSDFDEAALVQAVEEDESLTTRILAEQFHVDQSTIVRRLRKLGKVWKITGWVPHELSGLYCQIKSERTIFGLAFD